MYTVKYRNLNNKLQSFVSCFAIIRISSSSTREYYMENTK